MGKALALSTNPQACARGGLRPCAACSTRGKNLPVWRGRHGADLNGQVSDRRRAPHRAEHACRGIIPVIAERVHVPPAAGDVEEPEEADLFGQRRVDEQSFAFGVEPEHGSQQQQRRGDL